VETNETVFTSRYQKGQVLNIPIAHGEGCYVAQPDVLADLKANNQIVFRYVDAQGEPSDAANPNGTLENIAGIRNKEGNVLGMMPHPERACEALLGSTDGLPLFQSLLTHSFSLDKQE
jgi:phosphoribosylformylglycinamidine synthase